MADHHDSHAEIHLPPNSFVPFNLALALAITFAGFLIGPYVWIPGLVYVAGCLIAWAHAARQEYLELPKDSD